MRRFLSILLLAVILLTGCQIKPMEETEATAPSGSVAPPASKPSEPAVPDAVQTYLQELTLAQKVGQLFIAEPEQLWKKSGAVTEVTGELKAALEQYPVGGMILFAENLISPEQLTALTKELQAASQIPLFIATDEEGGRVARLANHKAFNLPKYENAAAVGSSGNPQAAQAMGSTIGAYLKEYGLNLNFAPVADVNTNKKNPIIGTRAFSSDPLIADKMAKAFAQGLREKGVAATFKHFPGHGDTVEDSHIGLATNRKTKEELQNCEWIPFQSASRTDMVMVGHIALPQVTGNMLPASMSKEIVTGILKQELGFSGLVITDALNMGAITKSYTAGEAAVTALQAGCDILLMSEDLEEAFDAVMDALENGTLSVQWLDDTVYRILRFKYEHKILTF
ncbi:MAG: beta-N-acetylhexosaminidase [Ruminococcaceae bacterium]|nr:beta-N-acetylhexosaminidase [Oscillospiraceae bacterium]